MIHVKVRNRDPHFYMYHFSFYIYNCFDFENE
jgi:hypothetical protein